MNAQMEQYALGTDLEKRIIPQVIQSVLSPDGHRIRLGIKNAAQLTTLSTAITAVLVDFSFTLVPRVDALWEARKQAKYIGLYRVHSSDQHHRGNQRPLLCPQVNSGL